MLSNRKRLDCFSSQICSSLPVNCSYFMRLFQSDFFLGFLILLTVPLMASYLSYEEYLLCERFRQCQSLLQNHKVKELVLLVYHLHRCEGRHCLFMRIGLRCLLLLVSVQWGCAFVPLILLKLEAYCSCGNGLCLNLWMVSTLLGYFI